MLDTAETFATIQAAIDDSDTVNGHTLTVSAGTYSERITIDKSINLIGADELTTIIDGGILAWDVSLPVVVIIANTVTVSGFTITGETTFTETIDGNGQIVITDQNILAGGGIALFGVSGCTIEDNTIRYTGGLGIGLQTADSNTIQGNTIEDRYVTGIGLVYSSSNTIESNSITGTIQIKEVDSDPYDYNYVGYGLFLDYGSSNNIINGNTFSNNDVDGVYFGESSDGNFLTNNIIANN